MANLFSAVSDFDSSQAKTIKEYSGLLGLTPSSASPEVPNRNGYVYVRFRDNQSEVVQAYNEEVSPVTNLPVIVVRQGGGWRIKGRDVERYSDWGSDSAFLPAHAAQHEFNRDDIGGDVVFIYSDAFLPMAVTPSGTGAGSVIVQPMMLKKINNDWAYVGNTGTINLLPYKPTNNQAILGVVYMDKSTGNPGVLFNTGTPFAATVTGSSQIAQYIPDSPSSNYEYLYAVRLVSGTSSIGYGNLYDIRQFYGGASSSGTGGGIEEAPVDGLVYGRKDADWVEVSGTAGGAGTPAGNDTEVQFNESGAFGADYRYHYDYTNNVLVLGSGTPPVVGPNSLHVMYDQGSPSMSLWGWRSNSSIGTPFIVGFRAAGTRAVPQAIDNDYDLFRMRARGYNGVNWTSTQAEILFNAPHAWVSGSHPTEISVWTTPSGTAVMEQVIEFNDGGANLSANKTYNTNGVPHEHSASSPIYLHGQSIDVPAGATRYLSSAGESGVTTAYRRVFALKDGILKNLFVTTGDAQPGSGDIVFTVEVELSDTDLEVTVPASTAAGVYSNTSDEVALNAGDKFILKIVNNASIAAGRVQACGYEFVADTE